MPKKPDQIKSDVTFTKSKLAWKSGAKMVQVTALMPYNSAIWSFLGENDGKACAINAIALEQELEQS